MAKKEKKKRNNFLFSLRVNGSEKLQWLLFKQEPSSMPYAMAWLGTMIPRAVDKFLAGMTEVSFPPQRPAPVMEPMSIPPQWLQPQPPLHHQKKSFIAKGDGEGGILFTDCWEVNQTQCLL